MTLFKTDGKGMGIEEDEVPNLYDPFFIIETCCIIWFTIEYLVR